MLHKNIPNFLKLRSDIIILEKVALDGSVECCAPPPRWCDLEL